MKLWDALELLRCADVPLGGGDAAADTVSKVIHKRRSKVVRSLA